MSKKLFALLALALVLVMSVSAFGEYYSYDYAGGLPLTEETVTFTIMVEPNDSTADFNTNYLTMAIEEACNVKFEFSYLPQGEAMTKLSAMLASGQELPDIICYGIGISDVQAYAGNGALLPIEDYLEDCPNFNAICEQYPEAQIKQRVTAPDGHIYGIPSVTWVDQCWENQWVNKEWMEKAGVTEMPSTAEEFYDMLVAFKNCDFNGNGEADEYYPIIGNNGGRDGTILHWLMNCFEYWFGMDYMNVKDGKVYPAFTTEAYKDGLKYIVKLFDEELIDPQTFTMTWSQMIGIVETAEIPCAVFGNMSPRRDYEYTVLHPFATDYTNGLTAHKSPSVISHWFVTRDCKNPELAVKIGDYMFTTDMGMELLYRYGVEGKQWGRVTEENIGNLRYFFGQEPIFYVIEDNQWGVFQDKEPANTHWKRNNPNFYYNIDDYQGWTPEFLNPRKTVQMEGIMENLKYRPEVGTFVDYVIMNEEETMIYNEIKTELMSYVEEMFTAFCSKTVDIDAEWDNYLATLDTLRLDEFVEVIQGAYDRL